MKIPFRKSKKGFTIVEVSLVLAIGGLIMLMVFIAWPAVQRNQRDSQRRTVDMPYLISQLANYNSQNHAIPKAADKTKKLAVVNGSDTEATDGKNAGDWVKFYNNYILINGASFSDPSSGPYGLGIITCSNTGTFEKPNNGLKKDAVCDNTATFQDFTGDTGGTSKVLTDGGLSSGAYEQQGGYVTVVVGAYCDIDTVKATTTGTGGSRNYAVLYAMEAGGSFCQSS